MSTAATLQLPNLELVSTLRVAPLNGPPSSEDYNDGEQEKLVDLTTFLIFMNNVLIPMLNTLSPGAATGIEGSNVYGDLTSQETIFFNSLTGLPLSVADSLRYLYGLAQSQQTTISSLAVQVAALQARLSSSNQNDIALALQGFTANLNAQLAQIRVLQTEISELQQLNGAVQSAQATTPVIAAGAIITIPITWSLPFSNDTYTVAYSIEDDSEFLHLAGFTYQIGGSGIIARVRNTDTQNSHQGVVQALACSGSLGSVTGSAGTGFGNNFGNNFGN